MPRENEEGDEHEDLLPIWVAPRRLRVSSAIGLGDSQACLDSLAHALGRALGVRVMLLRELVAARMAAVRDREHGGEPGDGPGGHHGGAAARIEAVRTKRNETTQNYDL
ncbi:hypothetical protein DFH27DRAFT_609159 [Peziza echinospora]|nr:hypothetical protein DFH27DRAFT_609159 [Peziza echinospora]